MVEATLPVEFSNPGQVFACLGFLEAAEVLLGDAEGCFDWTEPAETVFRLSARGEVDPIAGVLEFLASAEPRRFADYHYADPPSKKAKSVDDDDESDDETEGGKSNLERSETFPAPAADRMSLPIRIGGGSRPTVEIGHWADGSSRNEFKLYAGNRSAYGIARAMLAGVHKKPTKKQTTGEIKTKGIRQLWEDHKDRLTADPLNVLTPMGGSFNFDPRGAWTAIDAGYSLNDQGHQIESSPVVEFLAAWGLENARPDEFETRRVRYSVWGVPLGASLARVALTGGIPSVPMMRFRFHLDMSGKNKVVRFAEMESGQ